jgi:hypothetical protein
MQFFLYEIVARIVAIYLCVDCGLKLWGGLAERKIAHFNTDVVNWLLMPNLIAERDAAPVRYWIEIGLRFIALLACLFVAIFGWRRPDV